MIWIALALGVVVLVLVGVEARHLLGGADSQEGERVGQTDTCCFGQPQAGLGQLRVFCDHTAIPVEAVEGAREVTHPGAHLLGRSRLRRLGDDVGVQRQRT